MESELQIVYDVVMTEKAKTDQEVDQLIKGYALVAGTVVLLMITWVLADQDGPSGWLFWLAVLACMVGWVAMGNARYWQGVKAERIASRGPSYWRAGR